MLSPAQATVLKKLSKGSHITPADVHHMTIQALVERKFVKLAGRKADKTLVLTAKGQKALSQAA
jgi:hypothetical protein